MPNINLSHKLTFAVSSLLTTYFVSKWLAYKKIETKRRQSVGKVSSPIIDHWLPVFSPFKKYREMVSVFR